MQQLCFFTDSFVCIEAKKYKKKTLRDKYLWVVSSPVSYLGYFPNKPQKKKHILSLLVLFMIKGFGSFSGGLCIHGALVLQRRTLSSQCVHCTFIHTHSILIRCGASRDSRPLLSASGRKAGQVSLSFFFMQIDVRLISA